MQTPFASDALKGFKTIQASRNQGDPTSPEKLWEAGYEGDEFLNPETTASIIGLYFTNVLSRNYHFNHEFIIFIYRCVLEVELVSHANRNVWFIFEVELDGRTPITRPSWVMSKVPTESYGSGDSFSARSRSVGTVFGGAILDLEKKNYILVNINIYKVKN